MKPEISSLRFLREAKMILCCLIWVSISLGISFCSLSHAADVSMFAGGEFDDRGQGFSYLGVDVTQSINKTLAFSGRVIPNYLTYEYYSGDDLIKAKSSGLFAVAGIKLFWDQTMLGFFGGAEFRNTDLSPDDRNSSVRGDTSAGVIQGELDSWLTTRTNVNVFASYSGTSDFLYEKGRIKQQITNLDYKKPYTMFIGAEQFIGRNTDFRGEGYGVVVQLFHVAQKASIAVRGGLKHDSTFGDGVYWGLELYKGF